MTDCREEESNDRRSEQDNDNETEHMAFVKGKSLYWTLFYFSLLGDGERLDYQIAKPCQ